MKIPHKFSYDIMEPVKKHRGFVWLIITLTGVCVFFAVLSAIKFNKSALLISFSNVSIVKFLRGSSGFGGMLFSNILTTTIFAGIIVASGCKKYTISIGVFFYSYYVYAQTLILIAFMLEYGIINTIVVAFCMLISMSVMMFLLLELFMVSLECQNNTYYFRYAFGRCMPVFAMMLLLLVLQAIIFFVLRNYMIVLVY